MVRVRSADRGAVLLRPGAAVVARRKPGDPVVRLSRYRVLKVRPNGADRIEETWVCGPDSGCGAVWLREAERVPDPFWGPNSHTHKPRDPFTGCPGKGCTWHDPANTSTIVTRER